MTAWLKMDGSRPQKLFCRLLSVAVAFLIPAFTFYTIKLESLTFYTATLESLTFCTVTLEFTFCSWPTISGISLIILAKPQKSWISLNLGWILIGKLSQNRSTHK